MGRCAQSLLIHRFSMHPAELLQIESWPKSNAEGIMCSELGCAMVAPRDAPIKWHNLVRLRG